VYVATGNPRRTLLGGKKAIYGWTLTMKTDPSLITNIYFKFGDIGKGLFAGLDG
jgi:hypothetical protein